MFIMIYLTQVNGDYFSNSLTVKAIFLNKQFIHYTQITLCPYTQFLYTQKRAYQSLSSYFQA